jgi:hypothetical protein
MPINASVADHEDVTALETDRAAEAVAPQGVGHVGKQRVVAVDRFEVDRLPAAGWLGHRVDRHAVVDPCRCVACEQMIGQRREHEPVERRHLRGERVGPERQLAVGDATDQPLRELLTGERAEPFADLRSEVRPERGSRQGLLEHRLVGIAELERLAKQLVQVEDFDAAFDQGVRERVVLLAGTPYPQDVVEQQLVLVGRGEPKLEVGPVNDHATQCSDLGANVQAGLWPERVGRCRRARRGFGRCAHRCAPTGVDPEIVCAGASSF